MVVTGLSIAALLVSYPALSHDIFNYLFNAKMVLWYQANPHVRVALDFPQDPWLAFMHNVHTPAPYAYGWTLISLLPVWLSRFHLQTGMLLMRVLVIVALGLVIVLQEKLVKRQDLYRLAAFALNPLVMIETVSNIHNDVVMMALSLGSVWIVSKSRLPLKGKWVVGGAFFLVSVSIKYASVMLLVGYLAWKIIKRITWGTAQMTSHFLPLLTARSKLFLPWYLIWPLSFIPFEGSFVARTILVLFSFTGLLSYLPYLYTGDFSDQLQFVRMTILFSLPLFYGFLVMIRHIFWRKR
jgi:hypothetical protein